MTELALSDVTLHYTESGSGAETMVFSHGLLFSEAMFAPQIAALKDRYRCLSYDFRDQGASGRSPTGYDMDILTDDTRRLLTARGISACHFVGLSMGGFVGLRLALRHPDLIKSLILIGTTADPEPAANRPKYALMAWIAKTFGMGTIVDRVMPIMFGRTFMSDPARAAERAYWRAEFLKLDPDRIGRAVKAVIRRAGVVDQIANIRTPTLILAGEEDAAIPPDRAARMRARIPGARLVRIPRGGHTCTLEEPQAVNRAIGDFLAALSA